MVWQDVGRYGVRNGRTVRSPSKPMRSLPSVKAGYITKVVVNRTNPLEKEAIKKYLNNFNIADGFERDSVVTESEFRGFDPDDEWNRGYQSYDLVFSLNKKKRWLLPTLLEKKINEEKEMFEEEGVLDPRVVLIERKSNNGDHESSILRLKKGDCHGVLDSNDLSNPAKRRKKRRKLCHVGDKYKRSEETEIIYEVCSAMATNSWPNYKETRSNPARFDFWYGDFRKRGNRSSKKKEMIKYSSTLLDDLDFDCADDMDVTYAYDEISITQQGNHNNCVAEFDLEACIANSVNTKVSRDVKHLKKQYKKTEAKRENINPASSKMVSCYGKGCARFIDSKKKANENKENKENKSPMLSTTAVSTIPPRMENNTFIKTFELLILEDSLHSVNLQERFKSRYIEAESVPRRFVMASPFCKQKYLIFEPCSSRNTDHAASCKVLVTLIGDNKQNECKFDPCIVSETCNKVVKLENLDRVLNVNEVVDIFDSSCVCCRERKGRCDSKRESSKIRKTVVAFDLLNSITGHKTEVCSKVEVSKDICSAKREHWEVIPSKAYDYNSSNSAKDSVMCEICYTESCESFEGYTALLACDHWFCNDCWKMYLVAQLQQGRVVVSCPAVDCVEVVDEATFMSLAPRSYFKYKSIQQDRALELSLKWKWCPGNKCQLVTKVTNIKRSEPTGAMPLPCMCTCSQIWCFGCQEEPHWPAPCNQAQIFRQRTKKYQELIASGDNRVTSVSVRRCPNCKYPLEKDGGCPHMVCTKCHGEFCWTCLNAWGVHSCEFDAKSEEVELTDIIGSARFNKHVKTSTYHKKERKVGYLFKLYRAVEDVTNAVDAYCKITKHSMLIPNLPSRTQTFLALCHKNKIPEKLKLIVDTKFISHSVIEGATMHMATSKTKKGHQTLQRLINDLHFVIIRLDYYLTLKIEDLCSTLVQVMVLVESAKALIIAIGQGIFK